MTINTPPATARQKGEAPFDRHHPESVVSLYRIGDLAVDDVVVEVTITERDADAMNSIGLAGVSVLDNPPDAIARTEWSPLAGRDVRIWATSNEIDVAFAELVIGLLKRAPKPPASLKVVALGGLQFGEGLADFIEARRQAGDGDEQIRRMLEGVADLVQEMDIPDRPPTYQTFPLDVLPEPIRSFVSTAAQSIGCDPAFVALPLLAVCAAAVGGTRVLQIKQGWSEPAIMWTAIVAESGTSKTPAFRAAMKPLRDLQSDLFKDHQRKLTSCETERVVYSALLSKWKRDPRGDPPAEPVEPTPPRCIVSDVTTEALAPILAENERYLLLALDELSGWFARFDRYAGGKGGGDVAHWLSMFSGESMTVDRKSGDRRMIYVERAGICVCGGIQPGILRRALDPQNQENGLAARLLLAMPPRRPKRWTETGIDPADEARIAEVVERLRELQPNRFGDTTEPIPLRMTPEAKRIWIDFYGLHAVEQNAMTGNMARVWSKLECYTARLALVVHLIRGAAKDPTLVDVDRLDETSMRAGITLSRWFGHEAKRVYAMMGETPKERERRRLVELIESLGGTATIRDVQRGCAWIKSSEEAEAELIGLVEAGYGTWQGKPASAVGGRPTRKLCLHSHAGCDKTPVNTEEKEGFVTDKRQTVQINYFEGGAA